MTRTHRSTIPAPYRILMFAFWMLCSILAATVAHAQGQPDDPPGRVARLSDVDGQVWLFNGESNEWVGIERNRPLTSGDRIATDNGARAEITLGSTTLRLDAATELDIVDLDDRSFHVHLASGSVAARIRVPQAIAEFGLETDEGRFRATTVGRFRFDRVDQASELTVYDGQAVFEGRQSALPLTSGQHAQFWLDNAGAAQYNLVAPTRDSFAAWNDDRDRAADRPVATRFVSPEMTGAADLDDYGGWEQTPDYGAVWIPRGVSADWAPYSAGHWAWVRPWGWTWVDDAPWGFAPFHYGRWVNYRDRWCWAPGNYVARPVYAPALVAWIGGPAVGVSLSIGGGGPPVGWFPLAPHEVYVPSYRASPVYLREVNITHVTNVTIINNVVNNTNGAADHREFMNRRFPNAVTVVPSNVFTGRQQVGPAAAQYRGNPQVRAFVSDTRPGPAMNAPPVAAPSFMPRGPEGRPPARPPFEARMPGGGGGRPGAPGPLGMPSAAPTTTPGRPGTPQSPVQRPPQSVPDVQRGPDGQRGNLQRQIDAQRVNDPRMNDAARTNDAARLAMPVRGNEAPRGNEAQRGDDVQRGVAPARRGDPAQRGVDTPTRPITAPQRPLDAPRTDAPRQATPPTPTPEPPRAVEAPRVASPEATRPPAPDPRANRPDAQPRRDEKRVNDKKDEKS